MQDYLKHLEKLMLDVIAGKRRSLKFSRVVNICLEGGIADQPDDSSLRIRGINCDILRLKGFWGSR